MLSGLGKPSPNFRRALRLFLLKLLPIYIQRRLRNEPAKATRESPTSYLNGFRGIMALLVFVRHFSLPWQSDLDYGFGQGENHTGLFRLPVLRILYAGPNVPVFLIVSGFVLSYKPLGLLSTDQKEAFLKSVVSSVFRRAIRMFPPPIFSSYLFMMAVHFRLFQFQYGTMEKFVPHHPEHLPTFFAQFKDWLEFVFTELTTPWSWKIPKSAYGGHLWTIGLQYRSSMVLFLVLIGLANVRQRTRQAIIILLFMYCMLSGRWDVALYMSGMFMAGTTRRDDNTYLPVTSPLDLEKACTPHPASRLSSWACWLCTLLVGLYLASYPRARGDGGAPLYKTLYGIHPYYQYWQGCGAILLVWSLFYSKALQIPFNYSFPQYLGNISYSLYIVHEPLLHIIGFSIVNKAWILTGKDTILQYQLGFFLALFLTTLILLVSEITISMAVNTLNCLLWGSTLLGTLLEDKQ
jgi:peptidoglycan/LPS O-acetylase OafA/YrhL